MPGPALASERGGKLALPVLPYRVLVGRSLMVRACLISDRLVYFRPELVMIFGSANQTAGVAVIKREVKQRHSSHRINSLGCLVAPFYESSRHIVAITSSPNNRRRHLLTIQEVTTKKRSNPKRPVVDNWSAIATVTSPPWTALYDTDVRRFEVS